MVSDDENPLDETVKSLQESLKIAAREAATEAVNAISGGIQGAAEKAVTAGLKERSTNDAKRGFDHLGDFGKSVFKACGQIRSGSGSQIDERLKSIIGKAPSGQNELTGEDGGFLVPPEFANRITEHNPDVPNLYGLTDSMMVSGNSMTIPGLVDYDRSDSSTRNGGVEVFWTEEGGQKTQSQAKFENINLRLHKLAGLVFATDEMLEDSGTALDSFLTRKMGEAMQDTITDAILNGDGVGKPIGILNTAALVTASKDGGQAADTFIAENAVAMDSHLFSTNGRSAVWVMNPQVKNQLPLMTIGDQPIFLPQGSLAGNSLATLLGRPIIFTDHAQGLGDLGDVFLLDLSWYSTITKGIQTAVSIHLRFDFDETAFRCVWRTDGRPTVTSVITPANASGSFTMSPFVTLEARA